MYGQDDANPETSDGRGLVPEQVANNIRRLRAQEQWERYDSISIGPGSGALSRGWFDTWQDFAQAEELQWFSGRGSNVGQSYTNQNTERTDWAQDIYQVTVQFITPPGISDLESNSNDVLNLPLLFQQLFPSQLHLRITLAESDDITSVPADHMPAGFGTSYPLVASAAAPVVSAGNNGEPIVSNTWKFPNPVMLAAKSKITVRGRIDSPIRQMFANISGPGSKILPTGFAPPNDTYELPNRYVIKVTMRGPRYLQLRGARSSA